MSATPEEDLIDAPYVGLRPYRESERHLLYGRDDDAARLVNKIFSNQLTLLYAASGVGKTSLLRSLVVPMIRSQDAEPIYFDAWASEDPLYSLKQVCAQDVGDVQLESLTSAIQRGVGADRDVILILDQFETFLIQHTRNLESFRRDLGELVRTHTSVHVLISLREEFIAGLSGFRAYIPGIYNSNYRLERLQGEAARNAIAKPAAFWKKTVSPALVEKLLEDLRAEVSPDTDPQSALQPEGIEAPFLQLVCRRLWFDADRRHEGQLNMELYRTTGGKDAIIRSYIEEITSGFKGRETIDAAKILRFLAPPSGVKNSLSLFDIQALTSLPRDRIQSILNILAERIVLRTRQPITTQGDVRYELYHDAFTRVLRPWIDRVLYRARVKRAMVQGLAAIAVAGFGGTIFWNQIENTREMLLHENQQGEIARARDRAQTDDRVAFLHSKGAGAPRYAREVLGSVALYLLDQGGDQDLARLEHLLKQADQDGSITFDHGMDRPTVPSGKDAPTNAAPLTIVISEMTFGRDGSEGFFAAKQRILQAWRNSTQNLTRKLGIPIPSQLNVETSGELTAGVAKLTALAPFTDSKDHRTSLPKTTHSALLNMTPEAVSAVLVRNDDRERLRSFVLENAPPSECLPESTGKTWVYVPRWSLPVWQFRADDRRSLEALLICDAGNLIKRDPALVVTWPLLRALAKLAPAPFDPLTVWDRPDSEAIGRALFESLQTRQFANLVAIINNFAERSAEAPSKPTIGANDSDTTRDQAGLAPAPSSSFTPDDRAFPDPDPFERFEVYYSASIKEVLTSDLSVRIPESLFRNKQYYSNIARNLESIRLSRYEKTGFVGSNFLIESSVEPRIVFSRQGIEEIVFDIDSSPEQIGTALRELLARPVVPTLDRILWELNSINPNLVDEDKGFYSIRDTARILKFFLQDTPSDAARTSFRNLEGMVRSLAFWRAIAPSPDDHHEIAKKLQSLSIAFSTHQPRPSANPGVAIAVKSALKELFGESGRIARPHGERLRKILQSLSPDSRAIAQDLFIYLYLQQLPLSTASCAEKNVLTLLSPPFERLADLRRSLEIRSLLVFPEGSKDNWSYRLCNMESLASRTDKVEAKEFFSSVTSTDEPISVGSFPDVGRFLTAGVNSFEPDVDNSATVRPLLARVNSALVQPLKPYDNASEPPGLANLKRFCLNNSYIDDCWNFIIAVAENAQIASLERYNFAWETIYRSNYFWPPSDAILKRASDVLAALQKVKPSTKYPDDNNISQFDIAFAASFTYYNQAENTGKRADALACVTAFNRLRKEHKEVNFLSKTIALTSLGECLEWGGEVAAGRKLLDKAHQEATGFDARLYNVIAAMYVHMDDVEGLTRVLKNADDKFVEDVFDSSDAYLYEWVLGRLLNPKEDLEKIGQFIVETPKLWDIEFAKFVLSWRLRLLDRSKEANDLLAEYQDENVLNQKLKDLANGKLLRYRDWPGLLVRALVSGPSRVDELERYLTTAPEGSANPLRVMRSRAAFRLADLYFYRALSESIRETEDHREGAMRSGLQKVLSSNAPSAIEFAAAQALLKRPDITKSLSLAYQKSHPPGP